jgi:glyceraldehyde-3-phosphate dehydrogenase (NADP+)
MRFSSLCLAAALVSVAQAKETGSSCTANGTCDATTMKMEAPYIAPKVMLHGIVSDPNDDDFVLADVLGCCSVEESSSSNNFQTQTIGQLPQMTTTQTLQVLEDAKQAWKGGMGVWPQLSLKERVEAIENFLEELGNQREAIVTTLMWEIGKNRKDAEAEFDRTIQFCQEVGYEEEKQSKTKQPHTSFVIQEFLV